MQYRVWTAWLVAALAFIVTSTGCPHLPAGTVEQSLLVNGQRRTFLLHAPADLDGEGRFPLVIALHPFTGTGQAMEQLTGFSVLADREHFLVAYPDGRQRVWNADPMAPSSIVGPPADDIAFIAALIDHLVDAHAADSDRVYIAGASSGGLMAHRVACELTHKIAAAASVMITLPVGWPDHSRPSHPLPFLMIHGTADPFFPWEGGTVNQGPSRQGRYMSAEESVGFWVEQSMAAAPPTQTYLPDKDPNDGTTVFQRIYAPESQGAEVRLYGVNGGGHTWPDSADNYPVFLVGLTSYDVCATQVIWDFFKDKSNEPR